jgi:choline dehydrogenase-like flavoprotein
MPERDAGTCPDGTTLEFDYVVVGTGAAGITFADALAKLAPSRSICLLEGSRVNVRQRGAEQQLAFVSKYETTGVPKAEGLLPDVDHRFKDVGAQKLYEGEVSQDLDDIDPGPGAFLTRSRCRVFGGSTNCWGGQTRPLSWIDLDRRDRGAGQVWPISFNDLYRYYGSALFYCKLPTDVIDPRDYDRAAVWKGRTVARYPVSPLNHTGGSKVRTGVFTQMYQGEGGDDDGFLDFQLVWGGPLLQRDNVFLYRDANVRRVLHDGKKVTGISAQTLANGNQLTFRARRHYVVAAGGIETVRLLMLSGSPATGAAMLGRNFMVHPVIQTLTRLRRINGPSEAVFNFYTVRPRLHGEKQPTVFATLVPTDDALLQSHLGNYRMVVNFNDGALNLNWEQVPNPASRIRLSSQGKDVFGDPDVFVDWHWLQTDRDTITFAFDSVADELCALGLYEKTGAPLNRQPAPGDHHMGATRMAFSPSDGYVDENCTVHGVPNLHVASCSVFPTSGVSNPTLTIIALAVRLADHISSLP